MVSGGKEIEIKLRVGTRTELLRRLKRLGARLARPRVHEMNVLFDTPRQTLGHRGQLIRIRVERSAPARARRANANIVAREVTNRGVLHSAGLYGGVRTGKGEVVTLTYKGSHKGPPGPGGPRYRRGQLFKPRYKVRREEEVRVSSAKSLEEIFRAFGLEPSFCYEKYRQTFRLPGLTGVLVELDETPIGDFVELEGKPGAIDRAAALLGYGESDYIIKSYGELYESLRAAPGRFRPAKGRRHKTKREPGSRMSVPGMLFPSGKRSAPAKTRG